MSKEERLALSKLLGEAVKKLRAKKGWSAASLGRKADMSTDTVLAVEAGENSPQMDTIWKLAMALEVDPRELIPTPMRVTRKANSINRNKSAYSQSALDLPFQELQQAG